MSKEEFSRLSHFWRWFSVSRTMYFVLLALLLPTGASIYFFGYYALSVIAVSVTAAVLTEYLIKKIRRRAFVMDGSAVVTGLLFALILPPTLPLWMTALGSFFSIAVGKEAFGGLGHNTFNPALLGRAFMAASFPIEMTTWVAPTGFKFDAVTSATPLNQSFVYEGSKTQLYWNLFWGNHSGSIGETSILFIMIGGIILMATRIIDWRIPLSYLVTVAALGLLLEQDAIFQILAGGLMLGAFFMATDYVTSPLTHRGRLIFGIGSGVLTVLIRGFGAMPEGVCFAILFMNALVPLIDRFVVERPYELEAVKKS